MTSDEQRVIGFGNGTTHLLEHIQKGDVTLPGAARNIFDAYRSATNGRGGEKVGGCRSVGFDGINIARFVLSERNGKSIVPFALDFNAKIGHDSQSHINVRFGVESGGKRNFNRDLGIGRNHQQSGEKLA